MGGGTKRMSQEEKRKVLLKIYHESKQVYTEKEIIALATKAGINANTIPDINQSLIDDALVDKEKIGGSNFFWSFPGKKDRQMQLQHEQTLKNIESLKLKVNEANARLADAKRGREDEDGERPKKLAKLAELHATRAKLEAELAVLKENDPQALADLEKELEMCKEAANRWTDNIFACKSYLTKKRGMSNKEALKILGISSDFDYPEDKIPK
uniref:Meiotic nuclear division protein 1 homolog n=1 Tax=Leptocylindrus danicus TaxID=163516 RepID=A0A7S2KRV4_9STRA|mmetsp:Transcript_25727/g.38487  ORF Transcript_25727/g.38487 Transcript_25727/m.38487 type:complete len:212 (+) Transcript_25727:154-789(+)|eukprot:CAMPEP_0116024700 /NCGR_PEP_ID=MMETSP0321-20121206/12502_1 /TAXON_ID=163516 /ORGANISM="Leptocylindrus danicus var. danicus, Strain B650" /LENGTH=211 /DNA_ID=CAMNT_0003496539 /DNA_START=134 /DNA_END=769 /DNA_ORIENTATION=+